MKKASDNGGKNIKGDYFMFGKPKDDDDIKETKEERKQRELMEKYGLQNLSPEDVQNIKNIMRDLIGNGLMKTGMALSFANAGEQLKVTYLSALVEQNWIIIRQLDRINKKLDK